MPQQPWPCTGRQTRLLRAVGLTQVVPETLGEPRIPFLWGLLYLVLVTQSCLTLCNPMDCSASGSSVHGIFQAKIQEWVAISSSKGSS